MQASSYSGFVVQSVKRCQAVLRVLLIPARMRAAGPAHFQQVHQPRQQRRQRLLGAAPAARERHHHAISGQPGNAP